jgi:hypothetical protein
MRVTWRWLAVWVAVSGSNAACATPQNSSSQHVRDRRTSTTDASSPIRFPQEAAGPARTVISAEARVEGTVLGELVVVASAVNPTARQVILRYGGCTLRVRLQRASSQTSVPVWRSEEQLVQFGRGWQRPVCIAIGLGGELRPGERYTDDRYWRRSYPVAEILGDSLPAGRYHVVAGLILREESRHPVPDDTVWVAAGTVDLRR